MGTEIEVLTGIENALTSPVSGLGAIIDVASGLKELIFDDDSSDLDSLLEWEQIINECQTEILDELTSTQEQVHQLSFVCVSLALISFSIATFGWFKKLFSSFGRVKK